MADWTFAETWQVGDTLNAETLNRRLAAPNSLLLRRPLLVAHSSVQLTTVTSTTLMVPFDTIDQDDDGMVITDLPAIDFYAQRDGTYQVWFAGTFSSAGAAADLNVNIVLDQTLATRRWDSTTRLGSVSGQRMIRGMSGTVYLTAGQPIRITAWQNSGGNVPMIVFGNTPRIEIMWLGFS